VEDTSIGKKEEFFVWYAVSCEDKVDGMNQKITQNKSGKTKNTKDDRAFNGEYHGTKKNETFCEDDGHLQNPNLPSCIWEKKSIFFR